jgi:integrase
MKTPRTLPQVPSKDDVNAILAACTRKLTGVRNRAMIIASIDSALRASELCNLTVGDYHPADRQVIVRRGKGQRDRVGFLSPTSVREIDRYLLARTAHGRPFDDTGTATCPRSWRRPARSRRWPTRAVGVPRV